MLYLKLCEPYYPQNKNFLKEVSEIYLENVEQLVLVLSHLPLKPDFPSDPFLWRLTIIGRINEIPQLAQNVPPFTLFTDKFLHQERAGGMISGR